MLLPFRQLSTKTVKVTTSKKPILYCSPNQARACPTVSEGQIRHQGRYICEGHGRSPIRRPQIPSCRLDHRVFYPFSSNSCLGIKTVSPSAGFFHYIKEIPMATSSSVLIGIDVSKYSLEVAIHGENTLRNFRNDA